MGARKIAKWKWVGGGVLGLTLLAAAGLARPVVAQGLAPGRATVVVYNIDARAIDLDLVIGSRHQRLAAALRPDENSGLLTTPAGAATLELRRAGQGKARLERLNVRLRSDKFYCVVTGGPEPLEVVDLTRRLRADPNPAELCRWVARGR